MRRGTGSRLRRHPRHTAVAVLAAVLVACAGEGDEAGDDTTTTAQRRTTTTEETTTTSTTTSTTAPPTSEEEPFTYGDDPALDALWDACAAGDDEACGTLYQDSPVGSDYEAFGDTCGGRSEGGGCTSGPPSDGEGSTGTGDWAAAAEAACADAYDGAPEVPVAESGDFDDDMALFEQWHGEMIGTALAGMEAAGPVGDQQTLVDDMGSYLDLTVQIGTIYAGDYVAAPDELAALEQERTDLLAAILAEADALGVPSCGTVVELP